MAELPDSKIVVKNGKVILVEEWTLWNQEPWLTKRIERTSKGFVAMLSDPSHGGRTRKGHTIAEALVGLHNSVISKYANLFSLKNIDVETLKKDYPGYIITSS